MRKLIILAVLAALAIPAAALAEDTAPAAAPTPSANETCKLQLGQLGLATFRLTHGTLPNRANAFGKCVSKLTSAVADAARNAAKECKAEQGDATFATTHDGKTFAQVYGGDEKARNAFGKCVSSKARTDLAEQVDAVANAAKAVKFTAPWSPSRSVPDTRAISRRRSRLEGVECRKGPSRAC